MPEELIEDLLLRWEVSRRNGARLGVEEICADAPGMIELLRQRIRAIEHMESILGEAATPTHIAAAKPAAPHAALPNIPGYELIRVVGEGGMGVVYEARQLGLKRTVAVKMMTQATLPKQIARFRGEAESAARLDHPNVVRVFEIGETEGRPFFSMEYIEGGSLADHAAEPMDPQRAAALLETLAHAVQFAHERGVIHRDLKPANILLAPDGTPKIADFGIAKRLDRDTIHTMPGEVLGTLFYMAPEQAEGHQNLVCPATDVYAMGAILYELLAGRPPFKGGSLLETVRLITSQEPPPLRSVNPRVNADLEAICLKCLEKSPAARYPSAREFANDLFRFRAGQPVLARNSRWTARLWKWCKRRPRLTAALVALVLATLAAVAFFEVREAYAIRQVRRRAEEAAPEVRAILKRHCFECHGQNPAKMERNLDVLDHARLLGADRKIVVPGTPDDSRLIKRIKDGSMPPEEDEVRLPRLSDAELGVLETWILGGAPPLPAGDADAPEPADSSLAAQVKAIFYERCYECHNRNDAPKSGGIKIMHHRLLVSVQKVVVPGDPDASELFQLINKEEDEKLAMPPMGYDRLTREQIGVIRRWILEGAPPFPRGVPK